jgi:hypothetical protein
MGGGGDLDLLGSQSGTPPPYRAPVRGGHWEAPRRSGTIDAQMRHPSRTAWRTFLQICSGCGREVRTITEGTMVGTDCYACNATNALTLKPLRGSTYAAHFNIDCKEDNFENTGVDPTLLTEGYPLKVLCMSCQGSGTRLVKENGMATDCEWCGRSNSLAYVDPWTSDPCYDPQPLMPSAALAGLNQAPSLIFRIQANIRKPRECTSCHRHLRFDFLACARCLDPQCCTQACNLAHSDRCGGSFRRNDFWSGPIPQET